MKTSSILAILAAVVIAVTCAREGEESAGTTPEDIVAVNRMLVSLDGIAAEADLESFLGYVSDDAVFMPPDEPTVVGKQAIRDWYAGLYERFALELTHEPRETDAFGDIIIHRGNATGRMAPRAGGEPISFDNKYLFVIKKQPDGSLRIWRAIYNSNEPAPGTD
jgi:ketosteroid isomerase-like protein